MTENNSWHRIMLTSMDDLLDNPFDINEPLLPKEMQTDNQQNAGTAVKLLDRLTPENVKKQCN